MPSLRLSQVEGLEVVDCMRLPWWVNGAEITWPTHDPPAVWKSWGLHGGGLPVVESLRGAPVSPPRYGASADDGLPTLDVLPASVPAPIR